MAIRRPTAQGDASPPSSIYATEEDYSSSEDDDELSLLDFLALETRSTSGSQASASSTVRPSSAVQEAPVLLDPNASRAAADEWCSTEDSRLTCPTSAVVSRRGSFDRRLGETDGDGRARNVHSPVARKVMAEISDELKETHDELMRCIYAPEELGEGKVHVGKESMASDEYRWRPGKEHMEAVCGRAGADVEEEEGEEEEEEDVEQKQRKVDGTRIEMDVGPTSWGVRLRGGGLQEFLGLKNRPEDADNLSQRPRILTAPFDAPSQVEGSGPGQIATGSFAPGPLPAGGRSEDARLRRLQPPDMPKPTSFLSKHGSGSFNSVGRIASIAPEGSVMSYNQGLETMDVHELPATEERVRERGPQRQLGSPMQSPVKNSWYNFSRRPGSSSVVSGAEASSSGSQEDTQTSLFARQGYEALRGSTTGSLRRNRRPIGQGQMTSVPLLPVQEQNAESSRMPPNNNVIPDGNPTRISQVESEAMGPDQSNRSVWHGGDHLSIVPGDSITEVGVSDAWRAQQMDLKRNQKVALPENSLAVLEERAEKKQDTVDSRERAKERSEDGFREEIHKAWGNYQTRMRMINEDVERSEDEKERAAKDEQRYLESWIGQASTDTGFEQLHETGQKDEFIKNMFGLQPRPSRTPAMLKRANKMMKWILAVPDDPDLKTNSSRRQRIPYSELDPAILQRRLTGGSDSRAGPCRARPTRPAVADAYGKARQESVPRSSVSRDDNRPGPFHFAPTPAVHAMGLGQVSHETLRSTSQATSEQAKAWKTRSGASEASSETGWPTQSQVGRGE